MNVDFDDFSLKNVTLNKDGNQWCALWGPNLIEGIVGFGNTKEEAIKELGESFERMFRDV